MDYKTIKNITTLIELLQRSERGVPVKEIRDKLEMSDRNVYRLRNAASDLFSIDIVPKPDPDGPTNSKLWAIGNKNFRLPVPLMLDDESWVYLQLLLGKTDTFKSKHQREIEAKIRNAIRSTFVGDPKRNVKTSCVKFTGARDYSAFDHILAAIGTCLRKNEVARVTYRAAFRTEEKKYEIEPYTLVDHGGALYLVCAVPKHDRNLIRLSVDRIVSFTPAGKYFTIPDDYDPDRHLGKSFGIMVEEPIRVSVRLFGESAFYAQNRVWGTEQEVVAGDDSITLSFTASGIHEIMRWVLSCGKDAVVLAPARLAGMVREEHEGALERAGEYEAES